MEAKNPDQETQQQTESTEVQATGQVQQPTEAQTQPTQDEGKI
jgi:hypothetical protein